MRNIFVALLIAVLFTLPAHSQWVPIGVDIIWTPDSIGIGTTNPRGKLEVTGGLTLSGTNNQLNLYESNGLAGKFLWNDAAVDLESFNDFGISFNANNDIDLNALFDINLATDGSQRMRITDQGDVSMNTSTFYLDQSLARIGIGTINPGSKLHVAGDMMISGSSATLQINSTGTDLDGILLRNDGIEVGGLYLNADSELLNVSGSAENPGLTYHFGTNKVGIGISNPAFEFQVNGNVNVTGELTAASDARLKTDIQPIQNALEKLSQLNPVTYRFKTESFPGLRLAEGEKMGLVAQEVESILPNLVVETYSQYSQDVEALSIKHVNYLELVPLLIKSVQELKDELIEKDAQIQSLQERIEVLEGK